MSNNDKKTLSDWQDKVAGWVEFRPEENHYKVAREMFTDRELFDLEMELIFENNWIYACHESQIPNPTILPFAAQSHTLCIGTNPQGFLASASGSAIAMIETGLTRMESNA
ncbi:hypothetical protein [Marinobacterium aestuariivivens]|uniref:Uncharacterized protein n=1 Tax=Marinobacterium aestuariivivens TaxID=1698799 RepID=A0ABW2A9Y0_9GAMM